MKRTHGAFVNRRPDGSVVIEQPDGTRDVYRRGVIVARIGNIKHKGRSGQPGGFLLFNGPLIQKPLRVSPTRRAMVRLRSWSVVLISPKK